MNFLIVEPEVSGFEDWHVCLVIYLLYFTYRFTYTLYGSYFVPDRTSVHYRPFIKKRIVLPNQMFSQPV